jgi:hypothetical protein
LFFSLLDALLHQAPHRLLKIAGVVHVVVELVEHRLGIEPVAQTGVPTAVANACHESVVPGALAYLP